MFLGENGYSRKIPSITFEIWFTRPLSPPKKVRDKKRRLVDQH